MAVIETRKKVKWKVNKRKSRQRVWKSKWVTIRSPEKSGKS